VTYDQAVCIVKTAMKSGQTVGVSWDEIEETYVTAFEAAGQLRQFDSYERAIRELPERRRIER
jgi:hypothetical protein